MSICNAETLKLTPAVFEVRVIVRVGREATAVIPPFVRAAARLVRIAFELVTKILHDSIPFTTTLSSSPGTSVRGRVKDSLWNFGITFAATGVFEICVSSATVQVVKGIPIAFEVIA